MKHGFKIAAFVMICALYFGATAQAVPSKNTDIIGKNALRLEYDVYAGGFHALDANLAFAVDQNAYEVAVSAQTGGFIGKLFPWRGEYTTTGSSEGTELIPALHEAKSIWKKDIEAKRFEFGDNGALKSFTVIKNNKDYKRPFQESLALDAVDMLTGALRIFQTTGKLETCNTTIPVFDGKRRFEIEIKEAGKDYIKKTKYSSFEGEALRCELDVKPAGGFKKKDMKRGWMLVQNHSKEHNKQPTIWIAKLSDDTPPVIVKMMIGSMYGAAVAHLTDSAMPEKDVRVGAL